MTSTQPWIAISNWPVITLRSLLISLRLPYTRWGINGNQEHDMAFATPTNTQDRVVIAGSEVLSILPSDIGQACVTLHSEVAKKPFCQWLYWDAMLEGKNWSWLTPKPRVDLTE